MKKFTTLGFLVMVTSHVFAFEVTSSAFTHNGHILSPYTCEEEDPREDKGLSPPLEWKNAPANTQSFVLICYDPDVPDPKAPQMTFYHWLLFNIPRETTSLPEGVGNVPSRADSGMTLPVGTKIGENNRKQPQYKGPCPPIGEHRYYFEVYALDIATLKDEKEQELPNGTNKDAIEQAMKGHVLGKAVLMGTYKKHKLVN